MAIFVIFVLCLSENKYDDDDDLLGQFSQWMALR